MNEDDLLAAARELATRCGWLCYHTHDSRRSEAGFPDIVLCHPRRGGVVFLELKAARGDLSDEQVCWRDWLIESGAEWHLVRPHHLEWLAMRLGPHGYRGGVGVPS